MCRRVLCILVTSLVCVSANLPGPLIVTQHGTLRGTYGVSVGGRTYSAFQGIPYAKPPVGKQRFKEPVIAKPWRGVWNAVAPSSECLQYDGKVVGDEDCLYLNVFTPSVNATGLLDVIVYIHGGAFMQGAGHNYGPDYLMDRDVVYISINYRLGVLGFFSTGDAIVPGNNGLKDQVLALQWIQKNIAMFGGDPTRVTIAGTSAGGASVHFHYLSPLSTGLFHRGISPSGTSLLAWTQAEGLQKKGETLASLIGCPTVSTKDLLDCLRHRPARVIVEQIKHFSVWAGTPFSPWGPTVEMARPGAFLTEQPIDILMEGRAQPLPWLTGVTTQEGLYPGATFLGCPDLMAELATRWEDLAPLIMDWDSTVPLGQRQAVAQRVKQFYLGEKPVSPESSAELIQMFGDRLFVVDGERAARIHADYNAGPVYFYQFGYRGKHSLSEFMSGKDTNWGVSHADETFYVLDAMYARTHETEDDRAMSRVMVDIWVNFAITGNPAPTQVIWEPLQPNQKEMPYLWLGNATNIEMRSTLDLGHRQFWDSLPIREPQVIAGRIVHSVDEL